MKLHRMRPAIVSCARSRATVTLLALIALIGLVAACSSATAQTPAPATLAVIGFELVDDHPDPARDAEHARRLGAIHRQLEAELARSGLYQIIDIAAARDLIDAQRGRHEFVYRCNGCLAEVGARLQTRLVAVGWVQRVSQLILNINVAIKVAETDEVVLSKSVDLRGNTDETWARGISFMVRDWVQRRAGNPRYGI